MSTVKLEKEILQQLQELPTESIEEVLDFTLFLKQRIKKRAVSSQQMTNHGSYLLAQLGGTEPDLTSPPRRREERQE